MKWMNESIRLSCNAGGAMRQSVFDNMKGFGILLVILGHVWIAPEFLRKLIYSFHMPMFFMLSGYLFNVEKKRILGFGEFAWSRVKRLYFPALFIGFTCAIPAVLTGYTQGVVDFAQKSFGIIYSIPKADLTFNCTPIWFLTCLLCVEIYFYWIVKYATKYVFLIVLCLFSVGLVISRELSFFSPLNAHVALSGLFFFYIGNVLRNHQFVEKHDPKWSYAIVAFFLLVLTAYLNPTKIGMAENQLGDLNYLMIGVLGGSYLVLFLAKKIGDNQVIGFLGQNTIFILGYNYWACSIVDRIFNKMNFPYNWFVNFAVQVVLFYLAACVLKKMPLLNQLIQGGDWRSQVSLPVKKLV